MTLQDYLSLDGRAPEKHIAYGAAPSQFVELFLPEGSGPRPVVVLLHGGCWTVDFGGIRQMRNMASALAAKGAAVWNVEYRRYDEEGGGYPGMYQDVASAVDLLREHAAGHALDLTRIVAVIRRAVILRNGPPRATSCRHGALRGVRIRFPCPRWSAWAAWQTCATKQA
jgi:hypothetical protein